MKRNYIYEPWDTTSTPPRVKAILEALKRTQAQLADVLGVSFVTVNRWCNAKTVPDRRSQLMLEKLEEAYVRKSEG
jgi:transcriptional regulator with XRE-family HTH domain